MPRLGLGGRGTLTLLALLEPIAVAVHLQDVDVVRELVEQRAGEPLGGEYPGLPTAEKNRPGWRSKTKPADDDALPCPGFVVGFPGGICPGIREGI